MGRIRSAVLAAAVLLPVLVVVGPAHAAGLNTFTVTVTGDGGDANIGDGVCANANGKCTLRAALQEADHTAAEDAILFNIPTSGGVVPVIKPSSVLPGAGNPIFIDGSTEPSVNLVSVDGTNVPGTFPALNIIGGGSHVRDMNIENFKGDGILLAGANSVLDGNRIGTNAAGKAAQGNADGVAVSATGARIISNTIAFNAGPGIIVDPGDRNSISDNSIFANGGLGIDLAPAGVNPNDNGDFDLGANGGQNFPVLTSARSGSNGTLVKGTINSQPFGEYRIEFFSSGACDPSGNGEGATSIGSTTVDTDSSGNASFVAQVPFVVQDGKVVTATATSTSGNTSEFSACRTAVGASTVYVKDAFVTEGNSGTKNLNFPVTLSPASARTVTVNFSTGGGTATAGTDYTAKSGQLTFAPGQTSKVVAVSVKGDTAVEPNETFNLTLSTSALLTTPIGDLFALGTIVNDDGPPSAPPPPSLYIADQTVIEGNVGTNAVFRLTLSPSSTQTVTVHVATANGTATAGTDYTATSTTLTFSPGQTAKTFTVPVTGDTALEKDETFGVNLSSPTNAVLGDTAGLGTILNDD